MPAQADGDMPQLAKPSSDVPIHVNGDAVEYFNNEQKVVGTGNVSIDYDGTVLKADKITVYLEPKRAVAEGHVTLTQNGSVFRGERAEYDFKQKMGQVSGLTGEVQPSYFVQARTLERVDPGHFRTTDTYLTTCCGDDPLYRIKARSVDVYPGKKVTMRDAFILVRGVPVLWVPFLETYFVDFNRFPIRATAGKTSDWGAFVLSKWRYHLVEEKDLSVHGDVLADWRERRGFGGGSNLFYRGDKIGRGALRGYYIEDGEPPIEAKPDRYRGQWRHQGQLTPDTSLTIDINKTSDDDFIKDFFYREEYEREVAPDNYVSLIQHKPEYALSFLERMRLNDFYSVTERDPQVRYDTHTQRFMELPFYWRQEAQFDNVKREFKDPGDDIDVVRGDLYHTFSYAGHAGPVSIVPRAGLRQTMFSRDVNGDDSHFRMLADLGTDISTHFYKVYDYHTNAFGLDYNQIRHLFNPTLSYNYRAAPTTHRTKLHQFDEIDAFDKENLVRVDLINKLQTKDHSAPGGGLEARDLARIVPYFETDLKTGHWQNAGLDVEVRPYSWLGIEADALYDTNTRDVTQAGLDIAFTRGDVQFALGQRYAQNESSQLTADLKWKVRQDIELHFYERFEFQTGKNHEFEATVSKIWSCVTTDITYNHGIDSDAVFFSVRLNAFPDAGFKLSQSYNRPKQSSQTPSRFI